MDARPVLAPDAEMVLGIAATAIPFARTAEAEVERWLRVLRLHGEVGVALQALGVSEVPLGVSEVHAGAGGLPHGGRTGSANGGDRDAVTHVTDYAARIASRRCATGVTTTDVLMAVMHVYGADFDHVLWTHGTDRDEVLGRLGARMPAAGDG
jgi:hypothetical protein